MYRVASGFILSAILWVPSPVGAAPVDLVDPATRPIVVEFETSADLATVGASYSGPIPATYSSSGGARTIVIDGDDYESLFGSSSAVLESSDIVIEIDATTGAASVVSAAGTLTFTAVPAGYAWSWTLDSSATIGFIAGGSVPPLLCSSQAEVDTLCLSLPSFCGATCVLMAGSAYDPSTGKLNMVGHEHQDGCGEAGCIVIDVFTGRGDLRLSEAPPAAPVPALPSALPLVAGLLSLAAWRLRRATARPGGRPHSNQLRVAVERGQGRVAPTRRGRE